MTDTTSEVTTSVQADNSRDLGQIDGYPNYAGYLPLFRDEIARQGVKLNVLGQNIGLDRSALSRKLQGQGTLSYEHFDAMFKALNINRLCAYIAVETLGDWQLCNANSIRIAADIASTLPQALNDILGRDIDPLRPSQCTQLTHIIAERLHRNQLELERRQTILCD